MIKLIHLNDKQQILKLFPNWKFMEGISAPPSSVVRTTLDPYVCTDIVNEDMCQYVKRAC